MLIGGTEQQAVGENCAGDDGDDGDDLSGVGCRVTGTMLHDAGEAVVPDSCGGPRLEPAG
jgi:hypothetical protein